MCKYSENVYFFKYKRYSDNYNYDKSNNNSIRCSLICPNIKLIFVVREYLLVLSKYDSFRILTQLVIL